MLKRTPRLPPRVAPAQYNAPRLSTFGKSSLNDTGIFCSAQSFCHQASTFQQNIVEDMNRREKELKEQSERLEKDMNELQNRFETVSKAEKRLAKVQHQLSETETALQARNSELARLTANHENMKQRIASLERRLETRAINIITAEGHITLERQRLAELKKKANDMIEEATVAKEEAEKLCKRYLNDKAKLDEHHANDQLKELQIKELKRKLEEITMINRVRDEEYACLRERQQAEAKHLQREKDFLAEKEKLCTARETAMALRERELERMLTELESLNKDSTAKTSQLEVDKQKLQLQYKGTIDSLTYRIKTREAEILQLTTENTHLKHAISDAISHENASQLQKTNEALSTRVEELSSHLITVNKALDNLNNDYLGVLEENKHNLTLIEHLRQELTMLSAKDSKENKEAYPTTRPISPAAKCAAVRIDQYNSILSRSQPVDLLKSALTRQKERSGDPVLDIMDLQQSNPGSVSTLISSAVTTHQRSNYSHEVGTSAVAASFPLKILPHGYEQERSMMQLEDCSSALRRDIDRATNIILIKMRDLQSKEELVQSLCIQIKNDAERIWAERQELEKYAENLNRLNIDGTEIRTLNTINLDSQKIETQMLPLEQRDVFACLSSEIFKKSFINILRLHKKMPEEDAKYILERIISQLVSTKRSDSVTHNPIETSTILPQISGLPTETSDVSFQSQQLSFQCKFCGAINNVPEMLSSRITSFINKYTQTTLDTTHLKEVWSTADRMQHSTILPLAKPSPSQVSQQQPSVTTPQQSSLRAYLEESTLPKYSEPAFGLQQSPLKSTYLQASVNNNEIENFGILNTPLKHRQYAPLHSQTAMDLSGVESEISKSTPFRSSRSRSLGKTTSNHDSRSVKFSNIIEQKTKPNNANDTSIKSVLLVGDSVHTLDSYLKNDQGLHSGMNPINLASSSDTMTSLIDPSPSTEKTPRTVNTSSMSSVSIGSHDRPHRHDENRRITDIGNLLAKTEDLIGKPLHLPYGDVTQTSISTVSRPMSSRLLREPRSSVSDMIAINLPDSMLLRRVEDILTKSGVGSTILDPPSLSQSGNESVHTRTAFRDIEPLRHFPLSTASKFSTIYGLESPGVQPTVTFSDDVGGSDSCLYV